MLFEEYLEEEEYLEVLNELIFDFIDSIDLESLSDEQAEKLDDLLEFITDSDVEYDEEETEDGEESTEDEDLDEAIKKRVVRKGKIIRKLICRKGFKAMSGRCIKMAASERRLRAKMAKRGAKKRRAKKSSMLRSRAKSMRIARRIN